MTVSSSITSHSYIPAGAMLAESLAGLVFINASDLVVTDPDDAVQVLGTDYEITGNGRTGAASIRTLRVYGAGIVLTVSRVTGSEQLANIQPNQPLPAESVETELDRRTLIEQETRRDLSELNSRSVKVPKGQTAPPLPFGVTAANKLVGFDALGQTLIPVTPVGGADDALRTDLADPLAGDQLVAVQETRFPNAPALNLRKWIQGGVVNAKQQALPANFVHATDDAWQYLQNLIADMEAVGPRNTILLPTADDYRITQQLAFGALKGSGIMGFGPAKPSITYVGAPMDPLTQDNASGAMITWGGFDHAWGGIKDIVLFAASKAVHCLYIEGDITPGWKCDDVHGQHALLDIVSVRTAGYSASPVNMIINKLTSYPYIPNGFSGISAVCGRSVIRFRCNNSVGSITVRDANLDNGALSFIDIDCPGDLHGIDYLFDNCRFEQNMPNGDILTLKYADGGSAPGTITFRNPKHAEGALGSSTTNFIRNRTTTNALRPDILIDPLNTNNAYTNVYKDDQPGSGKTVPYVPAEHFRKRFLIEHSADPTAGSFPSIGRARGALPSIALPASVALTVHDHDKRFTNNGAGGATTYTLPPVADVPIGFRLHFTTTTGFLVTIDANGGEVIDGVLTLTNTASRQSISIEKAQIAGGFEWVVIAKVGTWA